MKIRKLILLTAYCILILPLFAQNTETLSLVHIDELIAQTDYDGALAKLHDFIELYPEQFDSAQKRVRKIMKVRSEYAAVAQTLVDVIQNEPENDEKILAIIERLQTLEKNPTARQAAFVRNAQIAAQFNVYRKQFLTILQEGVNRTYRGDYTGAVEIIRSGFFMYQDDFFASEPNEAARVRDILASVDAHIAEHAQALQPLTDAVEAYIAAVRADDVERSRTTFAVVRSAFESHAVLRNSVFQSGYELRSIFTALHGNDDEVGDASFLPFVSRYLLGIDTIPDSGIAGTIDYERDFLIKRLKDETTRALERASRVFIGEANGDIASLPSQTSLTAISSFAMLGKALNNFYLLFEGENSEQEQAVFSNFLCSMEYAAGLSEQAMLLREYAVELLAESERALSHAAPQNPAQAELDGSSYAPSLFAFAEAIENARAMDAEQALSSLPWAVAYAHAKADETNTLILWDAFTDAYKKMSSTIALFKQNTLTTLWQKVALHYALCASSYVKERMSEYEEVQKLYQGTYDETTGFTYKYPSQAVSASAALRSAITKNKAILVQANTQLAGSSYVGSYASHVRSIYDAVTTLNSLEPNLVAMEANASEQVLLSQRAQNEADLRYTQAQRALSSNNFDEARRRLQEARTKYNESLAYQESETLREQSDRRLASLGAQIQTRQNEQIVRQVRDLKTRARTEYYNGNFDAAENALTQAKNLWAVTNIDEDHEITALLALVSTALSMKTGRVISPSAPLYPEMSQILSIAQQYFKQGGDLLKAGRASEGKEVLSQALKKLQELQLVYPLNQEASLLTLRIQQILDPNGFSDLFAQRVENARANYNVQGKQQQSYAELLDLYEINSSYPGLAQLIYNVEIDLGIRQKPQDRTAITRSSTLTTQAQNIVNAAGRDEVQLQSALSLVNEAIDLNPNNDNAILLKDRIQIAIGGQALIVLSSEDEAKYQSAIAEMQNNNIVTANALVEELLQKTENRRSSKIIDLQKKIRALL
ncbi:MAG: hypothetical protein IJR50_08025 [Treponema sp.]|nr:hypothetical protein [Treponema sp.]